MSMKKLFWGLLLGFSVTCIAPIQTMANVYFPDVKYSHVFAGEIGSMFEDGIIDGYPDGYFRPDQQINRVEFLKLALESKGIELSGADCFPDVRNEWFAPYVCSAKKLGVVEGYPDGRFYPERSISFVEATKIASELFDLEIDKSFSESWFHSYVKAFDRKALTPYTVSSFSYKLTRAEVAVIFFRLKHEYGGHKSITYEEIAGFADFEDINLTEELPSNWETEHKITMAIEADFESIKSYGRDNLSSYLVSGHPDIENLLLDLIMVGDINVDDSLVNENISKQDLTKLQALAAGFLSYVDESPEYRKGLKSNLVPQSYKNHFFVVDVDKRLITVFDEITYSKWDNAASRYVNRELFDGNYVIYNNSYSSIPLREISEADERTLVSDEVVKNTLVTTYSDTSFEKLRFYQSEAGLTYYDTSNYDLHLLKGVHLSSLELTALSDDERSLMFADDNWVYRYSKDENRFERIDENLQPTLEPLRDGYLIDERGIYKGDGFGENEKIHDFANANYVIQFQWEYQYIISNDEGVYGFSAETGNLVKFAEKFIEKPLMFEQRVHYLKVGSGVVVLQPKLEDSFLISVEDVNSIEIVNSSPLIFSDRYNYYFLDVKNKKVAESIPISDFEFLASNYGENDFYIFKNGTEIIAVTSNIQGEASVSHQDFGEEFVFKSLKGDVIMDDYYLSATGVVILDNKVFVHHLDTNSFVEIKGADLASFNVVNPDMLGFETYFYLTDKNKIYYFDRYTPSYYEINLVGKKYMGWNFFVEGSNLYFFYPYNSLLHKVDNVSADGFRLISNYGPIFANNERFYVVEEFNYEGIQIDEIEGEYKGSDLKVYQEDFPVLFVDDENVYHLDTSNDVNKIELITGLSPNFDFEYVELNSALEGKGFVAILKGKEHAYWLDLFANLHELSNIDFETFGVIPDVSIYYDCPVLAKDENRFYALVPDGETIVMNSVSYLDDHFPGCFDDSSILINYLLP